MKKKSTDNRSNIIDESTIDNLQPAPSKQKEIISPLILTMTQQEFDTVHILDDADHHPLHEHQMARPEENIEIDEDKGVFDL